MPLQKNEIQTAQINGYTSDGQGVAKINGQVVFVKGAIDGETCTIRILKATKTVAWAKIEEILTPSPHRVTPSCPVYGACGGCDLLHMDYAEELRLKHRRVADALERVGGLHVPIAPIIAAQAQNHYRNKAIFAVGPGPVTGFFRRRSHQIIPITACLIQREVAGRAALALREWMGTYGIPAYDENTQQGIVRHLFVRQARCSGQTMVCLVVKTGAVPHREALVEITRRHCPEVSGILLCINGDPGNTVLRGKLHTLWGDATLREQLLGLSFRLSPFSFFQVNPAQAEKLYAKARAYANLSGNEGVLDLYCGTGTITLILAQEARFALGAEIVEEAVRDAWENAGINGIEKAEFILADAAVAAQTLKNRGISPHVVVVDPPRKGLSPDVMQTIAEIGPGRVVYVSCDPATLARDLKRFGELGYGTKEVTPVDMFPRCAHVESVALLEGAEKQGR